MTRHGRGLFKVTSQRIESANGLFRDSACDLWGLKNKKKQGVGGFVSSHTRLQISHYSKKTNMVRFDFPSQALVQKHQLISIGSRGDVCFQTLGSHMRNASGVTGAGIRAISRAQLCRDLGVVRITRLPHARLTQGSFWINMSDLLSITAHRILF